MSILGANIEHPRSVVTVYPPINVTELSETDKRAVITYAATLSPQAKEPHPGNTAVDDVTLLYALRAIVGNPHGVSWLMEQRLGGGPWRVEHEPATKPPAGMRFWGDLIGNRSTPMYSESEQAVFHATSRRHPAA
jgi:hypothetical protein